MDIPVRFTDAERVILLAAMGTPQWWWMDAERTVWFWVSFEAYNGTELHYTRWEVTHMWRLLESRYHGHWNRPEHQLMSRLRRLVDVNMDHRGRAAGRDVKREFVSRKLHVMPGARI
jgi:hypothetical protein